MNIPSINFNQNNDYVFMTLNINKIHKYNSDIYINNNIN